jgi:predicted transcriptional regulator
MLADTRRSLDGSVVEDVQPIALSVPLVFGMGLHEEQTSLLNQSTRMAIYNYVKNNPGTHFRGLCDNLGLSVGVVQYHLTLLAKAGLISVYNDKRYRRYFKSKRFGETEMRVISLLRHETAGRILILLAENDAIFHKDLAFKLDLTSQALTWQINRLRKMGFVDNANEGMQVRYLLNEEVAKTVKQFSDLHVCPIPILALKE